MAYTLNMDRTIIINTVSCIRKKRLGDALRTIQPITTDRSYGILFDRLGSIQDDYELLKNYMLQGYDDPQRDALYQKLLRRMHRLASDADMIWMMQNDMTLSATYTRVRNADLTENAIKTRMEDFVSEVALLQLNEGVPQTQYDLYKRHHELMSAVFDMICVSMQWSSHEAEFYQNLVLSPTVDVNDVALIVSAVTLSCITHFDIRKFSMLETVYRQAQDEKVRQRALVGWALSLHGNNGIYDEMSDMVTAICADDNMSQELLEMQMQMYFCMNAEKDNDEIQRDIIPNLMKHNNFEVTRLGIVEKEEDPMQDILNPDATDKAMEEMERTFQRMIEMQKSGSDIYFGGFSKMKRLAFFYNTSNWFCPFYMEHPDLANTVKKLNNSAFLTNILHHGPFCDSDKYSFTLAMGSIIDKIPANLKSMLGSEEMFGPVAKTLSNNNASHLRLFYLQDLYRFFRLSDRRKPFFNPFGGNDGINALFLSGSVLRHTAIEKKIPHLGQFMLRRGKTNELQKLLDNYQYLDDQPAYLSVRGACLLKNSDYDGAIDCLYKALKLTPGHKKTMGLLARTYLMTERYGEAAQLYSQLMEMQPDNMNYTLNWCISVIHDGRASEAIQTLYRINYEHPDDRNVTRVLAWGLMSSAKIQQATKEYKRLSETESAMAEDCLNAGYCMWIAGDVKEAVRLFRLFLSKCPEQTRQEGILTQFQRDKAVLKANGISENSFFIMSDLTA